MDLSGCENLKEIPDLSEATKLQRLELNDCKSLVFLPSSWIRNLNEIKVLRMSGCIRLEFLPSDVNLASLHYLNLTGCARLRSFPRISSNISRLLLGGTSIVEDEDCFFIGIISRLTELVWSDCPMRYMPSDFCAEYLVELIIPGSKLVQRIVNLSGFYLTPSSIQWVVLNSITASIWMKMRGNSFCNQISTMPSHPVEKCQHISCIELVEVT